MDMYNISEEFASVISNCKKGLQEAHKLRGHQPRDRKSKEHAYSMFMSALRSPQDTAEFGGFHVSFLPQAYLPCTTPMAQLSQVMINDLQLETHHRGKYILLRSMTPPRRMAAITALMEDSNGDAILVHLYNQEDEDIRAADTIVTVGTLLLIKEPYFKLLGGGEYGICVDHLSDVVHLEKNDDRIPKIWQLETVEDESSAESLKIQGNAYMKKGEYWKAIQKYSNALDQPATTDQIETIKTNRSLAFLKTNQFDAVLADTNFPNFTPNLSEKALFRAAEALYQLERFSECSLVLEKLCSKFPQNSTATQLLGRAKSRCLEQATGEYNFGQLQEAASELWPPHLDFATYIGPVEIRQTESKGRGLFVTKAVKAGDLLLCEKAFSCVHVNERAGDKDDKGKAKTSVWIKPGTGQAFLGAGPDLVKSIAQKLYRNPSLASAVTALHHGDYKKASTSMIDGKPIVDTFLVERIVSLNGFGCPVASLASLIDDYSKDLDPSIPLELGCQKRYHQSCGIWVQASYINHSCISNAHRAFIGNMMIVRASRDMDPGTELTFWYKNPHDDHFKSWHQEHDSNSVNVNQPDKTFNKQWGFTCECAMCLDTQATSITTLQKRQKLMKDLKQVALEVTSSPSRPDMRQWKRLLTMLNQTYTQPAHVVPRPLVLEPQVPLNYRSSQEKTTEKFIEAAVSILTCLGFVLSGPGNLLASSTSSPLFTVLKWGLTVDHPVIGAFLRLRAALMRLGARQDAKAAEMCARMAYRLMVGEEATWDAFRMEVGAMKQMGEAVRGG